MPVFEQAAVLRTADTRPKAGWAPWVFLFLVVIGEIAFAFALRNGLAQRAWQVFLVNLIFWTGLACGAVMFSAVQTLTNANWSRPLQRLAEAPVLFLPVAFMLFWLLFIGKDQLYYWAVVPVPKKEFWLSTGFFFIRQGACLFLIAAAALAMVFTGIRADRRMLDASPGQYDAAFGEPYRRPQMILSAVYGIFFGFLLTLTAFDLIMSVDPHWYSTLFGAYYFIGSFFTGLAFVLIISFIAGRYLGMRDFIQPLQLHNMGKMLLGFCLLTADFFYAQFFILWYGNIPEETSFILARVRTIPWEPVAWTVLIVCFALPFILLLSRRIKLRHDLMVILCGVILVGMWLERFLLVVPSLWKNDRLPLGIVELFISLGFLGIMGLCVWLFLRRYPLMPVSDPLFWKGLERISADE